MARTGVLHPVVMPIIKENYGAIPTYGKGFVLGRAITVDKNPIYGDNPLHADNREIDNDKEMTSGDINVNIDELGTTHEEVFRNTAALLGGVVVDAVEGGVMEYHSGSMPTENYFGYGDIQPGKYADGKGLYFEVCVYYKTKFAPTGRSANTKGSSTTWQTDTVSGKFYPIPGMKTNENVYKLARFDTEAEAVAWLDEIAGIETAAAETTTTTATGDDTDI